MELLEVEGFQVGRKRMMCSLKTIESISGPVLYWMSRDQRVEDNWAMVYAQKLALRHRVPLLVCFCLVPKFLDATFRQFHFMLEGLKEVEKMLQERSIRFSLLLGQAKDQLPGLVTQHSISTVVCDFSPLRVPMDWVSAASKVLSDLGVPLIQVDAHNIVPCWITSDKQEYAARTIRGKITGKLPTYLIDFPPIVDHPHRLDTPDQPVDWEKAYSSLDIDNSVGPVSWAVPGSEAGLKVLEEFCKKQLSSYDTVRNDPTKDGLSKLSPWFHFGQVSVQRAALTVKKAKTQKNKTAVDTFIEEAVVRRELSDNFCFYNEKYDSLEGAHQWAQDTLKQHEKDEREKTYSLEEFENAKTHDPLWNAAQLQMVREGKMHGFMRMYWAKKILEWTDSPAEALKIAINLNDKYELDGRDPNGYVGCMWSICGVHDRGWPERPVFGKIRYMNYAGCKRKFDVDAFISKYTAAAGKRKLASGEADIQSLMKKKTKMSKN